MGRQRPQREREDGGLTDGDVRLHALHCIALLDVQAMHNMQTRFQDATPEDLEAREASLVAAMALIADVGDDE